MSTYSHFQASNVLGKASKIGSGLFSKLKSGINDLTESTLSYVEQKGWDQQLRSEVGINLPRSGPKHSQFLVLPFNIDFSPPLYIARSLSSSIFHPFFEQKHRHHRTWRQWRVKSTVISVSLTSPNPSHHREKNHLNRRQYSLLLSSLEISLTLWTGMMVFTDLSYFFGL